MFHNMPFILVAVVIAAIFGGDYLPTDYQAMVYGASLTIKSLIIFLLPLIIFGLLFKTSVQFAKSASKLFLFIIGGICISSLLSTLISFSVGNFVYQFDMSLNFPERAQSLLPLYQYHFPKWIENSYALILGLVLGGVTGFLSPKLADSLSDKIYNFVNLLLKVILLLLPILVGGFVLKMSYDQVIGHLLQNYSLIFCVIGVTIYLYLFVLYFVLNQGSMQQTLASLKNMLPATIAGFGSMSSAAAMPLTIVGVAKNAKQPELAQSLIPATLNIHLLGDYIAVPIFAFAVLKSFGMPEPALYDYFFFAIYYFLAKFSVAAVPGGVILVMLPLLETHLGFTAEMLSLITALSLLFDPVITGANILGNGVLALFIDKLSRPKPLLEQEKV